MSHKSISERNEKNKKGSGDPISRREFLKRSAMFGAAVGASVALPKPLKVFADDVRHSYDLVAVRGGSPGEMFDRGIREFGGLKAFIRRGQTVLLKPNVSWAAEPEIGATTNPELIGRVADRCFEAGAKKVYVLDHTIDNWKFAYEATGVKEALNGTAAQMVPGTSKGYYQEVRIREGKNLRSTMVHEMVLEADVIINLPILKHHGSTLITSALKNLMGLVWDRWYYHSHGLNQCIADFPLLKKPTLNVIDAYLVMKSGGPRGTSYAASLTKMKMQILSPDIVAADTAAAKTWGTEPENVRYIAFAEANGLGTSNLDSLKIKRISI